MSQKVTMALVLVGHFAGKTVELNGLRYTDGRAEIHGTPDELAGIVLYHQRSFNAYLEGSAELAMAQGKAAPDAAGAPAPAVPAAPDITPPADSPDKKLIDAILALDPDNNDHWIKSGLPAMEAVEANYGSAGPTRKDIEAALPGYNREAAVERKANA